MFFRGSTLGPVVVLVDGHVSQVRNYKNRFSVFYGFIYLVHISLGRSFLCLVELFYFARSGVGWVAVHHPYVKRLRQYPMPLYRNIHRVSPNASYTTNRHKPRFPPVVRPLLLAVSDTAAPSLIFASFHDEWGNCQYCPWLNSLPTSRT